VRGCYSKLCHRCRQPRPLPSSKPLCSRRWGLFLALPNRNSTAMLREWFDLRARRRYIDAWAPSSRHFRANSLLSAFRYHDLLLDLEITVPVFIYESLLSLFSSCCRTAVFHNLDLLSLQDLAPTTSLCSLRLVPSLPPPLLPFPLLPGFSLGLTFSPQKSRNLPCGVR
jgi:hypothetical protein